MLVVEVDGEDGVVAGLPDGGGDGEVDDDIALDGLAGVDARLTKQQRGTLSGGEFSQSGKAGVEVLEIAVLDGAGARLDGAVGGDEGSGEVFEEERETELVGDAQGHEGVEIVLNLITVDDDRVGLEDGVGGIEVDVGDGGIGGGMRGEAEEEETRYAKDEESKKDGNGWIATLGLGEREFVHRVRIAAVRDRVEA